MLIAKGITPPRLPRSLVDDLKARNALLNPGQVPVWDNNAEQPSWLTNPEAAIVVVDFARRLHVELRYQAFPADSRAGEEPDLHGRVRDLWFDKGRRKTSRHPDQGGNPKAKRWLALWTGPDGQEHSRALAKQTDALKYATAMRLMRCGHPYADPRRGAISVREYGEDAFLPSMLHLRPNSADTYASHLRNHIYPALGARKIGTITRTDVQSFVALVSSKVARHDRDRLRGAESHDAVPVDADPQVIPLNPCTRIKLPKAGSALSTAASSCDPDCTTRSPLATGSPWPWARPRPPRG